MVKMYDQTVFELDEGIEKYDFWVLNNYTMPPLTPISAVNYVDQHRHGLTYGIEMLSLPNLAGIDFRLKDSAIWMAVNEVNPEEVMQREERFRERMRPFIEDYDRIWGEATAEMMGYYEKLRRADLEKLTNFELILHFEEAWRTRGRMWDLHYYMMEGVFSCFILFENICKELLSIDDSHSLFHKLLRGFDNKKFQGDRGLWLLSQRALELGLGNGFMEIDPKEIPAKLEGTEAGRQWLKELRDYLSEYGWQSGTIFEFAAPTWIEDPTPAIIYIKQFVAQGKGFSLDDQRKVLSEEREQAVKEVMSKVPESKKEQFRLLLVGAQHAGSFSEEHDWYFDLYTCALMHRALEACGKRLKKAGAIDLSADIYFLVPDEIRKVLYKPEMFNLQSLVKKRRDEWEVNSKKQFPLWIGKLSFEEAMANMATHGDPVVLKVVVGILPKVKPELKADLYGVTGSPGVAEGLARIARSEADLAQVKPGEILVAPNTSVSWTPIFGLLKAVVVDRGASLSHAAVVSREYGIPCVLNTFEGTAKIKTGQRIRVDGDQGVVYILR